VAEGAGVIVVGAMAARGAWGVSYPAARKAAEPPVCGGGGCGGWCAAADGVGDVGWYAKDDATRELLCNTGMGVKPGVSRVE
jgi:hypothetical protein